MRPSSCTAGSAPGRRSDGPISGAAAGTSVAETDGNRSSGMHRCSAVTRRFVSDSTVARHQNTTLTERADRYGRQVASILLLAPHALDDLPHPGPVACVVSHSCAAYVWPRQFGPAAMVVKHGGDVAAGQVGEPEVSEMHLSDAVPGGLLVFVPLCDGPGGAVMPSQDWANAASSARCAAAFDECPPRLARWRLPDRSAAEQEVPADVTTRREAGAPPAEAFATDRIDAGTWLEHGASTRHRAPPAPDPFPSEWARGDRGAGRDVCLTRRAAGLLKTSRACQRTWSSRGRVVPGRRPSSRPRRYNARPAGVRAVNVAETLHTQRQVESERAEVEELVV